MKSYGFYYQNRTKMSSPNFYNLLRTYVFDKVQDTDKAEKCLNTLLNKFNNNELSKEDIEYDASNTRIRKIKDLKISKDGNTNGSVFRYKISK
jgi:hypothetical protein